MLLDLPLALTVSVSQLCGYVFFTFIFIHLFIFIHVAYGILVSPQGSTWTKTCIRQRVLTTGLPGDSLVIMYYVIQSHETANVINILKHFLKKGSTDLADSWWGSWHRKVKKGNTENSMICFSFKHPLATVGRGVIRVEWALSSVWGYWI